MQTNPNQLVKQRELDLQRSVHQNVAATGVRELLELARIKAAQAHANYLSTGPDPHNWALEKAWLEVIRTIEHGPKLDQIEQQRGARNG